MSYLARIAVQGAGETAAAARSHVYGLLARAFDFPTPSLASASLGDDLASAAAHLPFELPALGELGAAGAGRRDYPSLEHDYLRLFEVGAGTPFCPLYEGSHRAGRMKIMEELVRFYEHFGLQAGAGDRPDHLCTELEFMHYLAFKQAAGGVAGAELTLAQADFLGRRLCRWLPRLRDRAAAAAEPSLFYGALLDFAGEFCRRDLEWLKECRENPDLQIRPLPD